MPSTFWSMTYYARQIFGMSGNVYAGHLQCILRWKMKYMVSPPRQMISTTLNLGRHHHQQLVVAVLINKCIRHQLPTTSSSNRYSYIYKPGFPPYRASHTFPSVAPLPPHVDQ